MSFIHSLTIHRWAHETSQDLIQSDLSTSNTLFYLPRHPSSRQRIISYEKPFGKLNCASNFSGFLDSTQTPTHTQAATPLRQETHKHTSCPHELMWQSNPNWVIRTSASAIRGRFLSWRQQQPSFLTIQIMFMSWRHRLTLANVLSEGATGLQTWSQEGHETSTDWKLLITPADSSCWSVSDTSCSIY